MGWPLGRCSFSAWSSRLLRLTLCWSRKRNIWRFWSVHPHPIRSLVAKPLCCHDAALIPGPKDCEPEAGLVVGGQVCVEAGTGVAAAAQDRPSHECQAVPDGTGRSPYVRLFSKQTNNQTS